MISEDSVSNLDQREEENIEIEQEYISKHNSKWKKQVTVLMVSVLTKVAYNVSKKRF